MAYGWANGPSRFTPWLNNGPGMFPAMNVSPGGVPFATPFAANGPGAFPAFNVAPGAMPYAGLMNGPGGMPAMNVNPGAMPFAGMANGPGAMPGMGAGGGGVPRTIGSLMQQPAGGAVTDRIISRGQITPEGWDRIMGHGSPQGIGAPGMTPQDFDRAMLQRGNPPFNNGPGAMPRTPNPGVNGPISGRVPNPVANGPGAYPQGTPTFANGPGAYPQGTPFAANGPGAVPGARPTFANGPGAVPGARPTFANGPGAYPGSQVPFANNGPGPYPAMNVNGVPESAAVRSGGGLATVEGAPRALGPGRVPFANNGPGSIPSNVVNGIDDAIFGAGSGGAGAVDDIARAAVGSPGTSMVHVPGLGYSGAAGGTGPAATAAAVRGAAQSAAQSGAPLALEAGAAAGPGFWARQFPTLARAAGGEGALASLRGLATRPGMAASLGRGVVGGVADTAIGQPLAQQIGEVNGVAGDFASGFSTGAGYGFGFGPMGALVGGLGVGLGNTITGGGVTDLLHGEGPSALESAMEEARSSGQPGAVQYASALGKFATNDTSVWDDLGISDGQVKDRLTSDFNRLSPDLDQEGRIALLQELTANAMVESQNARMEQEGAGQFGDFGMDTNSILAAQAMGSQFMAPVAADAQAIGEMGQTALTNLAQGLPADLRGNVMDLANIQGESGGQMANAYMQQAYAMPQIYANDQRMAMTNQIAQQLQQQAIQNLPQFAQPGTGSITDLLSGSAGTGLTGDLAAMANL